MQSAKSADVGAIKKEIVGDGDLGQKDLKAIIPEILSINCHTSNNLKDGTKVVSNINNDNDVDIGFKREINGNNE